MLKRLLRVLRARRPEAAERESAFWKRVEDARGAQAGGDLTAAARGYAEALDLDPPPALAARALANLAEVYRAGGRIRQALDCYGRAIAADPGVAEIHYNLGVLLYETGQLQDAVARVEQATALQPGFAQAQSTLLGLQSLYRRDDPLRVRERHEQWARTHADPLTARARAHDNDLDGDRRLRVGYVSGD